MSHDATNVYGLCPILLSFNDFAHDSSKRTKLELRQDLEEEHWHQISVGFWHFLAELIRLLFFAKKIDSSFCPQKIRETL